MKLNYLASTLLASGMTFFATTVSAAVTTDGHGNVGYDSYEECIAAVHSGEAKFYTPYTYKKPMRRNGETSIEKMTLAEVALPESALKGMPVRINNYTDGACDLGVGHSNGRDGVSGVLVGKYVPIAPTMPVNVYMNRQGEPVRITMQQCDNHFSGRFPTPVMPVVPAPAPQLRIEEDREIEAVVTNVKRTIRPTSYKVKEVLVVPRDQVMQMQKGEDTAIAIQNSDDTAVVIGNVVSEDVLDSINTSVNDVPVTVIPEYDDVDIIVDEEEEDIN